MPKPAYILIDAATRAPVPLPYYGMSSCNLPVSVHDFTDPSESHPTGTLLGAVGPSVMRFRPGICGLAIISEAEFMSGQKS